MLKDFRLMLEEAHDRGLDLPAAEASAVCAAERAETAVDEDFSAVARQMERRLERARARRT
jgi:hypothetical protein